MQTIETTHVGSLPRPDSMNAKLLRKQAISKDELDEYVTDVIKRQMALGITYVNNGELPRLDYVQSTVSRIAGFAGTGTAPIPSDLEQLPDLSRRFGRRNGLITLNPKAPVSLPACSEPLEYVGASSLREEIEMMAQAHRSLIKSGLDGSSKLFLTAPSPGTVAIFMENQHYPTYEQYVHRLAEVLKKEYEIIASAGFYLQVDCPDLAMGRHTRFRHLSDSEFIDILQTHIDALNHALSSIDPEKCRVHICWGNYPGTHHCDIELRSIFGPITRINARFISLEASNHRHAHEWTVFEDLPFPEDKVLMPGVVDTSSNIVEHPDLVAQRITRFTNILGPERVVASTDCGFATTASAASISGEAAWLKLAALVEGARRAGEKHA